MMDTETGVVFGFATLDEALNALETAFYWRGRDGEGPPLPGDSNIIDRARAAVKHFAEKRGVAEA